MDDSVSLEDGQVRADGIVGYAERFSQILDGPAFAPELGDYLSPRRHEELAVPLHAIKLRKSCDFFNKSSKYLTYPLALDTLYSGNRKQGRAIER
jgi:hypothetical protein